MTGATAQGRVCSMERDGTDGAGSAAEVERLQREIVEGLVAEAPQGWRRLEARAVVGTLSASSDATATMADGSRERFSGGGAGDELRLRDLQALPGLGAWFTLTTVVHEDGRWSVTGDDAVEVDLHPTTCAEQVRRFPRDPAHVPAWLGRRLRGALEETVPDAAALDGFAEGVVVQQRYAPDGVRHTGEPAVEDDPDEGEIARRMAVAGRVVGELARRGVAAEVFVEETDDRRGGALFEAVVVETVGTVMRQTVVVDEGHASFDVDRRHADEDDLTYRQAFALVRQVHEAVQVATGYQPEEPGTIAERVLAITHLDGSAVGLRVSIRRALGLPPVQVPDGEARRARACPACGWFEVGADHGTGVGSCPVCSQPRGDDRDAALVQTPLTWRAWWVLEGMPWRSDRVPRPDGWDPTAQLAQHLSAVAAHRT